MADEREGGMRDPGDPGPAQDGLGNDAAHGGGARPGYGGGSVGRSSGYADDTMLAGGGDRGGSGAREAGGSEAGGQQAAVPQAGEELAQGAGRGPYVPRGTDEHTGTGGGSDADAVDLDERPDVSRRDPTR